MGNASSPATRVKQRSLLKTRTHVLCLRDTDRARVLARMYVCVCVRVCMYVCVHLGSQARSWELNVGPYRLISLVPAAVRW
jgi:hypothetical protein